MPSWKAARRRIHRAAGRIGSLGHVRLALAVAVAALLLIASIFALSLSARPRPLSLHEVGEDDVGLLVEVQGLVRSARTLAGNHLRITLVDRGARLDAFVPGVRPGLPDQAALAPGARVAVTGEVAKGAGGVLIEASGPEAVRLVAEAGSETIALPALLDAPEYYRGLRVRTGGVVGKFATAAGDLSIRMADSNEGLDAPLLAVVRKPLPQKFLYRDRIEVIGVFDYGYEAGPGWRVLVEETGHAAATGPLQTPEGFAAATAPGLLADPGSRAGTGVHVTGLIVIDSSDVAGSATTISEQEGSLRVFVVRSVWTRTDVLPGDRVSMVGHLEYYRPTASWEFVVDSAADIVPARA